MTLSVAIIGYGKIARDAHYPAIMASDRLNLAAIVSERGAGPRGVPVFRSLDALLASGIGFDATSHCNTPAARFETAMAAIRAGKHVMLEKPPFVALGQFAIVEQAALAAGVTLMTAWHSQANVAVARAAAWLRDKRVIKVRIDWREDVRKWHPGQQWIWQPGGYGVFDPGINGLSVATRILPFRPYVTAARLDFPANRAMPIAAELNFGADGFAGDMSAGFDWLETKGECWQVRVDTSAGSLLLSDGGRCLSIDGEDMVAHDNDEYPSLYRDFAALIDHRNSYCHDDPMRMVCDAFFVGERRTVNAFQD